MAESKRSASAGVWRNTVLLLAVLAGPGMACKSTGSGAASPSAGARVMGPQECPAELLQPEESGTYVLSCMGMTPAALKVKAQSEVTFVSECDSEVFVTFSNPSTLFDGGVDLVSLSQKGEAKTLTVSNNPGCHMVCFGTKDCPPPDDVNSKTGSLDVHTSDPEPEPAKRQQP